MKLKSYFLLSIVVGMTFACSSDENVPEVEVFTPDATLSLAAVADGKSLTKAGEGDGENIDQEDAINSLHVMVFYADGNLQIDKVVATNRVEDLDVQSGAVKILVLANAGTREKQFGTLKEALVYQRALDNENENENNGYSMSSRLIEATLDEGKHNIFGEIKDFSDHMPNVSKDGNNIKLTRHIAQINLKSVSVKSDNGKASFVIDSVFMANVKGYSLMAANSTEEWGMVESKGAPEGNFLWWYGQYENEYWNGEYKTIEDGLLKADLLGFNANKRKVTSSSPWKPETGQLACGKSFIVYENMVDAVKPGQRTLLVLKGTYTDDNGRVEENRFYTIPVNAMGTMTNAEGGTPDHSYVKRNCFPDYTNPCFSDAKLGDYKSELANYRDWVTLFPDSEWIRYYATEGREGAPLPYLSHGSLASGFFTFRSGWKKDAAVMVVKAGPKGEWHCQPDNGTFEFWFNGKNLFPDSGAYVYAGSDEVMKLRNWFRQTRVHNTLTLDGRNFETTQSVTKLWQPEGREQILVTENPSYQGLKHRRTVFFVEQTYYVIVDEAVGDAKGTVNLNYHFCEGTVNVDVKKNMATTAYAGPSNVKLQCFPEKKASLKKEEGWRSIAYRQRVPRTSLSFDIHKDDAEAVRYITVIYPVKDAASYPVLKAKFLNKDFDEKGVKVEVSVNGVARQLMSQLK